MKRNFTLLSVILITIISGCASTKQLPVRQLQSYRTLSVEDRMLADTLIKAVLENEGLYTVSGKLKTISSVSNLYLKIADADPVASGKREVTDTASADFKKLKHYQYLINALNFGDLRFSISPFKLHTKEERTMQITIHRISLMDSLVQANQEFYGQFGFSPGTDPELLINTTEYEDKNNRFRSYGYLFGYPEHAVTFFLEAAKHEEKNKGELLKRDFFQIPVYSGKTGHFVYAVPKGYQATSIDSAIYKRAEYTLERFKKERAKHLRKDGTVQYYELLLAMIRLDD
ncbi:hypothetical protein [Pedobacter metabolipauper]|uniref:Lipoprotein n=1 Tax=Pedobacter metabolipauper TaxID=425513 RepID=A0A4R6T3D4_9SPHI|nr:hypothetical protein [Pedobacter metabolipauper]TDQ12040.1 hypothetical protein ATK78_1171 [Pedobacter metabolipauper]